MKDGTYYEIAKLNSKKTGTLCVNEEKMFGGIGSWMEIPTEIFFHKLPLEDITFFKHM